MLSPRSYLEGLPKNKGKLSPVHFRKTFVTNSNSNGQNYWFTDKEQNVEKKRAHH